MRHADAGFVRSPAAIVRSPAAKEAARHTVVWVAVWLALGAVLAFSFVGLLLVLVGSGTFVWRQRRPRLRCGDAQR
jgi:hypothetical protein